MRRFFVHFSLVIFGAISGLILLEIILRVAGIEFPVMETYDDVRGVQLRAGNEGWYEKEGKAYLKINSIGYRDVEHSIEKPDNTFRIAILGDSYVEARQVAFEDTAWHLIEKHLEECDNSNKERVEVLNFGVGGYATAQEYLTLKMHAARYSPDLVLLAITIGNDIGNNVKSLSQRDLSWKATPYFVLEGDELKLENSFKDFSFRRILGRFLLEGVHYFRTLQIINQARRALAVRKIQRKNLYDVELGILGTAYLPPESAEMREAWDITERILELMQQEADALGARFAIVTLTEGFRVNPEPQGRSRLAAKKGVPDLLYPERRLQEFGAEHQIPIFTLVEVFQREAKEQGVYFHGFENTLLGTGHWNENGHRLAADVIAGETCTSGLLASPDP